MDKLCKTCGQTKPVSEFHKDRSKSDGLNLYCKSCHIAKQREYLTRPSRRKDPEGFKTCSTCKTLKPVAEFYREARSFDGLQKKCSACSRAAHEAWRLANLDKAAAQSRKWRAENPERYKDHQVKQAYGLKMGAYEKMISAQGGKCGVCETTDPKGRGRFHVDHCHSTGVVRGLLCHHCNIGIGNFFDRVDLLEKAINYLNTKGPRG